MHNISCSFVVNAFTHSLNVINDVSHTNAFYPHNQVRVMCTRGGLTITFDLLWMAKNNIDKNVVMRLSSDDFQSNASNRHAAGYRIESFKRIFYHKL